MQCIREHYILLSVGVIPVGVWAVRTGEEDGISFNNTLVLSFVGQTR